MICVGKYLDLIEAYQRGRRKNLDEIVGKRVRAVEEPSRASLGIIFEDGTKLEVGPSKDSEAIYYKIHSGNRIS